MESVALLPELAELNAHLVEGAVPVTGAELQLLPPADKIHERRTAKMNARTTEQRRKQQANGTTREYRRTWKTRHVGPP
jgi:hypothetical protein